VFNLCNLRDPGTILLRLDSYRTFVAIELPPAVRAKVIEHIEQLRRQLPEARASWSREHNLHLTLKFLGNVRVSKIPNLSEAIERAAAGVRSFELTVAGCGVFPMRGKPNVLWIGVSPSRHSRDLVVRSNFSENLTTAHAESSRRPTPDTRDPLLLLHSAIEDECSAAGFPRESRPFHPHLTIARLRKSGGERPLAEAHQNLRFSSETFSVSEVLLFKSELLRAGSKHTSLSRHPLQK
jgi:2'-5' RNA ligase